MKTPTHAVLGRSAAALGLALALALGGVSVAGASSHRDRGRGFGQGGAAYVSAVSPTSFTVQSADGTATTYAITSTTTFTLEGSPTTTLPLVVGDRVDVTAASGLPGTAAAVVIEPARIIGRVVSVSGATITVVGRGGFTRTIVTTGATVFSVNAQAGTLASVTAGEIIDAMGTVDANGTSLDALTVKVELPRSDLHAHGVVTALTPGSSITITAKDNTATTYALSSTTTYTEGKTSVPATTLVVGDKVNLTLDASNTTSVLNVNIEPLCVQGVISTVGTGTFTVLTHAGATDTIVLEPTTTIYVGHQLSTLTSIVTGMRVKVTGTLDANGTSIDAQSVAVEGSANGQGNDPDHDGDGGNGGGGGDHGGWGHGGGQFRGRH